MVPSWFKDLEVPNWLDVEYGPSLVYDGFRLLRSSSLAEWSTFGSKWLAQKATEYMETLYSSFTLYHLLDKLMEYLGVEPGSVTPFAVMNDEDKQVTMILDTALFEHEVGNFHPLKNTATTTIHMDDLERFLKQMGHEAQKLDVSKDNPILEDE